MLTAKQEPHVLENDQGTMGTEDYLFLFMDAETAQRYADKYPLQKWKPRAVTALGLTEVKP